jgi:mannitol/fructose-specific phosphotransferase system IIA component (Ntr-type)
MRETIRLLVRLQELEFVRSEQIAMHDEAGTLALEEEIRKITEQLPLSSATLYRRLRKRDLAAVVPLHKNACSGCGFVLPTAQVGAVREGLEIQQCRNCRRILYNPEQTLLQHRVASFAERAAGGLERFSSPSLMVPALASRSRDGALSEMVERMATEGVLEDSSIVLERAVDRERVSSTALPGGLAFPHVRGVEGGGMVFALGLSREGLPFDPSLEQSTHVVVFTVIPIAASSLYLRLVRDLLQSLRQKDQQDRLLSCDTQQAVWRTLRSLVGAGGETA